MAVKGPVEVFHHICSHVSCAADLPVLDGLEGLGDSPQDPELHTSEGVLAALEVLYLQAEVPDQVEVNEGNWGDGQLLAGKHGEGPALDGKDVFFHLGGVLLTGG